NMADENIPALAPTRFDDQILPFAMWVPIGKSNHVVDLQKRQKNPIFQIAVDILQNTNFFKEFTASASVLAIYIQQFWNTLTYVEKAETYQFYPTKKGRKDKPHVIPYCRFMKLIIYHLGRIHNIHQRSASPFHLAEEDLRLGNLKFVSKGKVDEVFGMPISNELISNNIRNAPYYNAYLEMVAKHDQKVAAEKEGKKKIVSAKQPKSKPAIEKSSNPAPAPNAKVTKEKPSKASIDKPPKPKPVKEKSTKATPLQKPGKGKVAKVRTVKSSFQLVDEPNEEPAHSEPEPEHQAHVGGVAIQELVAETSRPLPVVEGKATEEASTRPSAQPQDETSANIVRDSPSPAYAEIGAELEKSNSKGDIEMLQITKELGEDVDKHENVKEKIVELDQDQA
ncbi:hypothetical protein Tco_0929160, partial [Tanacetum coccineum]